MPREFDSYWRVRLTCPVCKERLTVRILRLERAATLYRQCSVCSNDICVAIAPDCAFDSENQQNGVWVLPLLDLIYLEGGPVEEEGDRLLWGNKHVLEQRIAEYRAAIRGGDTLPAGNAT